jgi:hypothetical protein
MQIMNLYSRGSRFLNFLWIFNFLQFAIDGKDNYKSKVEKVFFFIFMSSYAEMSFFFVGNRSIWGSKNPKFYADLKIGLFIFVSTVAPFKS